ncbi:hypothetical protein EW146_g7840 [Bondarzewia mesenterica]|uniref:Vacuolar protein sorting-associated protein 54 C-terminal domain-containing protein n=1 Tax=Bondarzewia mesenterica TaxID=1095465 RepID=A0A4S4LKY0_9AGAM|nr:hypothetical protein EW146_g7840 [Bondarzewia mesenterica]
MSDYTSNPSRPASPVGPLPEITTARPAYRFNWDPSSRRPGPGSVSETTEGRGDYFNATPRVDIYGTSSTSVLEDAVPSEWSSSKHGFHAISTVVNNPHKRSAPPKAHSAVPSVPPADLPRVRRKDFDRYLKAIGPEWDRFQKSVELGRSGEALIGEPSSSASTLSVSTLDVDFSVPETPRTPRITKSLPPLSTVPQVFFEPNFDLGDPRTFNAVAETSSAASSSSSSNPRTPLTPFDPSALAHSLPLLEKLSHHADTLEQHLVHEIARRATPFFAALTNLQDLQAESARCLARIQSLRTQLQHVDKNVAIRGLEAVNLESRLGHLRRIREGVRVVGGVVEMVGLARSLVGAGQWGEALGVVEALRMMWEAPPQPEVTETRSPNTPLSRISEETPDTVLFDSTTEVGVARKPVATIPLSSLTAFSSLPYQLQAMTAEIAASLTSEVVGVLKVDLVERIYGSSEVVPVGSAQLRDRLRPLVYGLVKTKCVREAMSEWRGVALGEVKGIIKRHIPSFDPEDEDPKIARKVPYERVWVSDARLMTHADFLELLRGMYRNFITCIESLQISNNTVLEVLETTISSGGLIDMPAIQDALLDVLASSAEVANILASKAISVRAEQHSKLELREFVELFNESWSFVVRCEVICRRMIVGLRGVVVGQAKSFLQAFHQSRISQSAKFVEDEQWSQADVPSSLQRIADVLVDSAVHDPHEFILRIAPAVFGPPPSPLTTTPTLMPTLSSSSSRPSSPLLSSPRASSPRPISSRPKSPHPHINGAATPSPSKHLRIEERSYFAVIVNLSLLTTDTMSRVIEFLKAFNSRTCQVVLGAGAMRSAGLKNITAKHLALASQSLSIMIALIPYVRETFRRHLNPKQAVMLVEFDKLKRDYQEHQNEIHAKLIAIMGDRLSAHIKTLQSIRWDVSPSKPGINDYMEFSVVEFVMSQVFAANNHRLSEEYSKIELPSLDAKERLLADARFIHSKLSTLKNVAAPTSMLETVVSEKRIVGQPTSPLPDMPSPRPTPSKRTSLFANDRIKGILSRTHEKALPTPSPTVSIGPISPSPRPTLSVINEANAVITNGSAASSVSAFLTPQPVEKVGFRQVNDDEAVGVDRKDGDEEEKPLDTSPGSSASDAPQGPITSSTSALVAEPESMVGEGQGEGDKQNGGVEKAVERS